MGIRTASGPCGYRVIQLSGAKIQGPMTALGEDGWGRKTEVEEKGQHFKR